MSTPDAAPAASSIVVGVDGSEHALRAARWAAAEAAAGGDALRLVAVWSIPASSWPYMGAFGYLGAADYAEDARDAVRLTHRTLVSELGDGAPRTTAGIAEGRAAHRLVDTAADEGARMVVVGSRGRGGFKGLLLGSVATAALHHSHVPVVVIGDHPAEPGSGPIVVGIDDSAGARRALSWAADEARRHQVPLVVVHTWDLPLGFGAEGIAYAPTVDVDLQGAATAFIDEVVDETLGDAREELEVETRAMRGPAAEILCQEAAGASLLVVGTRGRGAFSGLVLGSVSQQATHHAPCPVAVIPEPELPTED